MIYRGKWFTVKVEELAEIGMSTPAPPPDGSEPRVRRTLHLTHKSGTQNRTGYDNEKEAEGDYDALAEAMEKVDAVG